MKTIFFSEDGSAEGLYSDEVPLFLLGLVKIERYSNVEFNNETQEWEARLESDNTLIAAGKNRADCIAQEEAYYIGKRRSPL
jgi:hypothetical protein